MVRYTALWANMCANHKKRKSNRKCEHISLFLLSMDLENIFH